MQATHSNEFRILGSKEMASKLFEMSVGHNSVPLQNEKRIDNLLSALTSMNLTKRRLTPAQIANLESLRKIKENNQAKI